MVTVGLVVMVGYLLGTLLGIMGGVGVTEVFLIELYTRAGIPEQAAVAGALLHRGLFYAYIIAVGGPCLLWESRSRVNSQ